MVIASLLLSISVQSETNSAPSCGASSSRRTLGPMILGMQDDDVAATVSSYLEFIRHIGTELRLIRAQGSSDTTKAFQTFHALADLERPARQVWAKAGHQMVALEHLASAGDSNSAEEMTRLASIRDAFSSGLLDAVREARTLVFSMPQLAETPACGALLASIDSLARETAASRPGSASEFSHGWYWSEVSVSGHAAPLFDRLPSEHSWERDAKGLYAPRSIVVAEAALLRGEELAPASIRPSLAVARAARLLKHAWELASQKLDHSAGAQWRIEEAARLADENSHPALAGQALAHLSQLLLNNGQLSEALEVAKKSLSYADVPLAKYLQATLRRRLGELTTAAAVHEVELQLETLAGQLPTSYLETQRETMHAELVQWRLASEPGVMGCFEQTDVAKIALCLVGKLVLP